MVPFEEQFRSSVLPIILSMLISPLIYPFAISLIINNAFKNKPSDMTGCTAAANPISSEKTAVAKDQRIRPISTKLLILMPLGSLAGKDNINNKTGMGAKYMAKLPCIPH